jgi:hypothetical protein
MENTNDKSQRILSYAMSYKLSEKELKEVSAAGMSYGPCGSASYNHSTHESDARADWRLDF